MPVVTFWSNSKKSIGQTVSASAVASAMAMEHNYKVLLICADMQDDTMEDCFGAQQSNKEILKTIISKPQMNLDTGTNGLLKMAQSNRVTPELIKDYTKIIWKNRLEVLYASTNKEISPEEQMEGFKSIILNATKYYDQVIVDLKKGLKYQTILDILDMSDAIVLNTEQGTKTLEKFFKIKEMQKYINAYKIIWNICRYDEKSKYNIKNLNRTVWKKQPIYNIPYNTMLYEASMEGQLAELLLRIRTMKTDDENVNLLKQAKELSEGILVRYKELRMRM